MGAEIPLFGKQRIAPHVEQLDNFRTYVPPNPLIEDRNGGNFLSTFSIYECWVHNDPKYHTLYGKMFQIYDKAAYVHINEVNNIGE